MPTMPAGFAPSVASYSYGGPGGSVRTETAGGPNRYRRDWLGGVQRFTCSRIVTAAQYSVWNAWFFQLTGRGALPFTMRLDSGMGTADHTVQMVPGSYSASTNQGLWAISYEVTCQASVYSLSSGAVAALASAYGLTSAALPAGFSPTIAAYSQTGVGGVAGSAVAGAISQTALRQPRGVQQYAVTLILTPAQMQLWTLWYHRINRCGVLTFAMTLDSGFGPAAHNANIVPDSLAVARTGGVLSTVSFVVEAQSMADDLSAADAQTLVDFYAIYGPASDTLLAAIAQFANVGSLVLNW